MAKAKVEFTEHQILASLCRESLFDFVKEFWDCVSHEKPVWNWHIEYLCGELQKLAEGVFAGRPREYDLVINVSPGTTKSTLVSVMFPAWLWTRMPSCRIIGASYAHMLAVDLSRRNRDVIKSDKYRLCFPEIKLREDEDAKHKYVNTKHGDRFAVGAGGSVLGMHGHFIIVDDPLDPEQAASEAELKIVNRWMTQTLPSRKVDKAVAPMVLVHQRLHYSDPTGVILERQKLGRGFPVKVIRLPADDSFPIEPPELKAFYKDGLFDPVRLPRSVLQEQRGISEYVYCAQYGQDPRPSGLGMFQPEYFNSRKKAAPHNSRRIRFWDRACLVPGTLVATSEGEVPIEHVRAGDYVLTRQGYKRVKKAWLTKYVTETVSVRFSNGSEITGTADHLIWTKNRGWVELARLQGSDYVHSITQETDEWLNVEALPDTLTQNGWNSTASYTAAEKASAILRLCAGTSKRSDHGVTPTTGRCGANTTGTSPLVMTFITRMVTGTTTRSITLSASPGRSITEHTTRSLVGTAPRRRQRCAERTSKRPGRTCLTTTTSVWSVPPPSDLDTPTHSALSTVRPVAGGALPTPVYDLEVEDAHEFFANGILVHNSSHGEGAYTAGVLLAQGPDKDYYVEHVVRGQWAPDQRNKIMLATALRDRQRYQQYEPLIFVEREGGSSGRDAWLGVVRALAGFNVREDNPTGKKEVRAEPWSAQLAAGNVHLVEDGSWGINDFIEEHLAFPDGKYKDQVDSAAAAFSLLAGVKKCHAMKVFKIQPRPKAEGDGLRIIVRPDEELPLLEQDGPCLVVHVGPGAAGLESQIDRLELTFGDVEPTEDTPYDMATPEGPTVGELMLTREEAKRLWAFLTRRRPENPAAVVFCEPGGCRRAASLALAVVDAMRLPRETTLHLPDVSGKIHSEAPNGHVYRTVRASRHLVV